MLCTMQLCLWSRTIQIYNMMKYENCFCVAARQQERNCSSPPVAGLPVYTLCQAKAFLTRLWLWEEENVSHGIKNMIENIIIKKNCKFWSLNMDLKRNTECGRQQGVVMLTSEASMGPPPPPLSLTDPMLSATRVWLTFISSGMVKKGQHLCCLMLLKPPNRNSHLAQ